MKIQRRRVLQGVAGAGLAGLAGCSSLGSMFGDGGRRDSQSNAAGDGQLGDGELVLATTTSTYDTGLLDHLHPGFEETYGLRVKALPKGTGASLRTARDGDADVVLVHAREAEDEFMRQGHGVNRRDVMYNDFVIVGPPGDPAGIRGAASATGAFETIAETESSFVSRGDDSGTHMKERAIWEQSGTEPGGTWYQAVGKGMGSTLTQADHGDSYTLADRGTFISMREEIDLEIIVQGPLQDGPIELKNPYGVIAVNPATHPGVNYQAAMAYIGYLTSPEVQAMIGDYTKHGEQLFAPNALAEDPDFDEYGPRDGSGGEG